MTDIILNERASAEQAIETHSLGSKPIETLSRVARYYSSIGYKKSEVGSLLEDFLLKCDPNINIVKWQDTIDRLAKASNKYGLVNIPGVLVTESEMNTIKALKSKQLQRLLFTMLCLAKYGNAVSESNNNWVNKNDKEIFYLADIKITDKRKSLLINDLWSAGLIGYSRVVDNVNINVKIVDEDSPGVLFVSDFRNIGNQYRKYCGEKYIECTCCGKVVKETNPKQMYCKECAVEVDREKAIIRYQKRQSTRD